MVDAVTVEKNALLGHLAILGPGTVLHENSEVGIASVLGFKVKVKKDAQVGGLCGIDHMAEIGSSTTISSRSYIGLGCKTGDNLIINQGERFQKG